MKAKAISFIQWQRRFSTEAKCVEYLLSERWPNGFQCADCGHDQGWNLRNRHVVECAKCHHQTSVTAGTLFHASKLPLTYWFWALYWVSSDKGSISALRLSKLLGVAWPTASRLLRKVRAAMGHQDSLYRLSTIVELDDAFVGGKRAGKRGRGAADKSAIVVAVEVHNGQAGFVAIEHVETVNQGTVRDFARRRLTPSQVVKTDAFRGLSSLAEQHQHEAKATPPKLVDEWLPWVHIVISNLKRYLLGTYHGVSGKYLQSYINEFVYRFNRRFWEAELPTRLVGLCVRHAPVTGAT